MSDEFPRELLLLRHAKSSWDTDAARDFDRPLAKRGRKDAPRMGRWLAENDLVPDLIVSSPATRARETSEHAAEAMDLDSETILFDERIYGAYPDELLAVLSDCPTDARRLMLVGHNPGMEELVRYLASRNPELEPKGKLMPTCAVAHLQMLESWQGLGRATAHLVRVKRPKEL